MSTHSFLIVPTGQGYAVTYCHFDGYFDGVGKVLAEHYSHPDRAKALSQLGAMSAIYPILEAPEGHSFANPVDGVCIAYHRDRGEKLQRHLYTTLAEASQETRGQFTYLWDAGWLGRMPKGVEFTRLSSTDVSFVPELIGGRAMEIA